MKNEQVLVIGANGTVGSELLKILKDKGVQVKATTSKEAHVKDGVEFVKVDLSSGEGIHKAFEGIDKAFLLSPPGYADQYKILLPLIQESKRRALKKVVLMTALGANASDTTPFRKAELELERSGLDYNIIRPNWFMQNFNTFWGQGIKEASRIALPAGEAKTSFIDARDIAHVAAELLIGEKFKNKDFDLTGPEALTHQEVAAEISRVLSREVVYTNVPSQELGEKLLSWGLAKDYVEFMLLIFGFLREGYNAPLNSNVELITGRKPRSFGVYAKDYF